METKNTNNSNMKTQEQLGAVHLRIEGLDKERFKKLVEGHKVAGERRISDELKDTCVGVEYDFIENSFFVGKYQWVSTDSADNNSRLITLDELEQLLRGERTPEVIQAEIAKLQLELEEIEARNKVSVGDIVITNTNVIGKVLEVDPDDTLGFLVGTLWCEEVTKIDPTKPITDYIMY